MLLSFSTDTLRLSFASLDWRPAIDVVWSVDEEFRLDCVHYVELLPMLSQILFPLQRGSIGVKFDWQHLLAHLRNLPPPYKRKNFADIFYTSRVIANFVPNLVAMSTGVRGKCDWQCQAALCLGKMWPRCVYDTCRKSCCRFICRVWLSLLQIFLAVCVIVSCRVSRQSCL